MMRSTSFIEYKELHSPAPSGIVYRKACQLHLHGNLPRDLTLQRQCGAELQSGKRFIRFWGTGARETPSLQRRFPIIPLLVC